MKERRGKVFTCTAIHKHLAHMADEDFKTRDVLFVDRVKKRHDALRMLKKGKTALSKGRRPWAS